MMMIALQIGLAVFLLVGAVRMLTCVGRQRSKKWEDLVGGLTLMDGRLSELSSGSIFSEAIDFPLSEMWTQIRGVRGLWAVYKNTGVLLEAAEYVKGIRADSVACGRNIQRLRIDGRQVRLAILLAFPKHLMALLQGRSSGVLGHALNGYVAFVAQVSLAISDYCPDLLIQYRYYVLQT